MWREGELLAQRIYPDDTFMASALEKCEQFVKVAVLPELLGKWYSKEPIKKAESSNTDVEEIDKDQADDTYQTRLLWCYCRKEESGEMIACDNTECHIQWFHTNCLHITKIPKGKWFCPDCRKKKNSRIFWYYTTLLLFIPLKLQSHNNYIMHNKLLQLYLKH